MTVTSVNEGTMTRATLSTNADTELLCAATATYEIHPVHSVDSSGSLYRSETNLLCLKEYYYTTVLALKHF